MKCQHCINTKHCAALQHARALFGDIDTAMRYALHTCTDYHGAHRAFAEDAYYRIAQKTRVDSRFWKHVT